MAPRVLEVESAVVRYRFPKTFVEREHVIESLLGNVVEGVSGDRTAVSLVGTVDNSELPNGLGEGRQWEVVPDNIATTALHREVGGRLGDGRRVQLRHGSGNYGSSSHDERGETGRSHRVSGSDAGVTAASRRR